MIRLVLIMMMFAVPMKALAEPVVVFAAASLRGALDEIFEGQDVVVSYGGSGAMAQQIARGAPADIYLSANVVWADWLEERGIGGARVDLLSNRLVIIANTEIYAAEQGDLAAVVEGLGFGMGQTLSVPVGIYARQSLEALSRWDGLKENVIEFPSAPAVLRAVELGEVPAGIVYLTDGQQSDRVVGIDFLDESTHDPIIYPMMLLNPEAELVFAHLQSEQAAEVFRRLGFIVLVDQ